jgi:predicted TIM-barrel fold metal-dependent hydrolase
MTAGGFRVLDVHHHVGDAMQALAMPGAPGAGAPPGLEEEMRIRLETMDRDGVDGALLIPGHSYLRPNGLADTRRINDGIAAYRDSARDRFPAALGIVEPLYGRAGDEEMRRIKEELGLVGVSFHTRFQGVATDSPLVLAQVELMGQLGLVPFLHSVSEASEEALWRVQRVARAFPDLTMIVLDAFSSHEQSSHAMLVAELAPNLVFDSSLAYTIDPALRLIERFGHERIVYGTDLYSHPLGYHHSTVLAHWLASDLKPEILQDVLAGTAERILGLEDAHAR